MPSPTYTLIASTTLSVAAADITFASIPNTYTDLVLRISAKSDATANIVTTLNISQISGSGSNLSQTYLYGTGTTVSSGRQSPVVRLAGSNAGMTANTFTSAEFYFPSYTVAQGKPFSIVAATENNSTTNANWYLETDANLWNSTSAITSIVLLPQVGNLAAGSTFYLYGIKNS